MNELWRKRLRAHLRGQMKYLRLVFNDHFVLVLIILFGALLYGYSQVLKSLTVSWWLVPLVALALSLVGQLGGLASLAEPADATFLLPQTQAYSRYLFKARRYSLWLPATILVLATLAAWPLIGVVHHTDWTQLVTLGVAVLVFKDLELWLRLLRLYRQPQIAGWGRLALWGGEWVAIMLGLWWHPAITMALALAVNLLFRWHLTTWFTPAKLDWLGMIAQEDHRMSRIYRFYNLFTDVPGLSSGVSRRRWLDPLAKLVRRRPERLWDFLYVRGFLRRTEWSGLTLRLALIGAVVEALASQWWLAAILAAVVVYLIGFQLLPFYLVYDEIVFSQLYPNQDRLPAFRRLVARVLGGVSVALAAGALVANWVTALVVLGVAGGVSLAFCVWYLPWRLAPKQA
ncbi:ABC transporter permease [Lacticaseibacillus nasuensis]|nr:ABC transporter permease [Lacticaseibacillus nasuensis]